MMNQIEKTLLLLTLILISGCVENSSSLTAALGKGVQAGIQSSLDGNNSKKIVLIDSLQVGLKSALDNNSTITKDNNTSDSLSTQLIDGVANHFKTNKTQ